MISYIEIRDFAVIKELKLDLFPGLNVMTGETGAGKSVIIEAVSMALGARADTDYVRTGADKAVVTIIADPEGVDISADLDEMGVLPEETLVIRREIHAAGRSLCRVNGMPVALSQLSRLCRKLADIHGQYDQQYLLDPSNHINILDLYGGEELSLAREDTARLYREYASASAELMSLKKRLQENARQKELLSFELSEIKAAALRPGEDEELEEHIALMKNSESILSALSASYDKIYGGDQSALWQLDSARSELESVSEYTQELASLSERVSSVYYELEDMDRQLRRLRDGVGYSEEEMDEAQERLQTISELKRKFGGSIASVLEYAEKAENSLSEIENADEKASELEKKISSCRQAYDIAAARLSELRRRAADILEQRINKELGELNFSNARFKVGISSAGTSENGTDRAEFLISANKGEDLKPLYKAASGGELSRIMLAMKRIIGEIDGIPTMIFDEIDTGISGATAGVVGEKLKSIARDHQIVCITHLPQIAARGDHHFRIEKHSDEYSTQTTVVPLSEDQRTEEIARLLSGTAVTDAARLAAKELLQQ